MNSATAYSNQSWRQSALVPTLVGLGLVIGVISSLGAPLVPLIAIETDVSLETAQWTLTGNLLVGAIVTPVLGRIASGARLRKTVLFALLTCAIGAALSALPLGFTGLLVGRMVQGVSLALLPLAISVARCALSEQEYFRAGAIISVSGVAGIGFGYPLTAIVAERFGLQAAFIVGAVLALMVLLLAWQVIPETRGPTISSVDWLGAVLLGGGVGSLLLALTFLSRWNIAVSLVGTAVLLLWWWIHHQRRCAEPLVDLKAALHPDALRAHWVVFAAGASVYMFFSLSTQYVQAPESGLGLTVLQAGLVVLPFSVVGMLGSRVGLGMMRKYGSRRAIMLSCLISALSLLLLALPAPSYLLVLCIMGIGGIGTGAVFAIIPIVITDLVVETESASALGFSQLVRAMGFAFGAAVTVALLAPYIPEGLTYPTGKGYQLTAIIGCALNITCALTLVRVRKKS